MPDMTKEREALWYLSSAWRDSEDQKAADAYATLRDLIERVGEGMEPPGCPTPGACSCPGATLKGSGGEVTE